MTKRGFCLLVLCLCSRAQQSTLYYPEQHWRTATPESQGLDSVALAAAVDEVRQKQLGVHSLLVIRHGYAVLDAYFYPFRPGTVHDLASVTKTMTSTITGIAVSHGVIKTDQPVLSFFPKERPADADPQKQQITIENLLHMESGLDCGYAPGEVELEQMKRSPNWVQYALALPMKYVPGKHSAYCSPGYHLLGSAIAAAAHESELDFARKNLFDPLGIRDVQWTPDPQGRTHGWGDSHLYPEDVAKIGYLYLHGGQWKGKTIIPRDWIEQSTTPPAGERTAPGGLGMEWNAVNGPNGRQYGGTGRGGQTLLVWPDLDMIVVVTGGGNTGQMGALVRKPVQSETAAPPSDPHVLESSVAKALAPPAAQSITAPPPIAAKISGKHYAFPINPSRIDSLAFTFRDKNEAHVDVEYLGEHLNFPIGLDGVYRVGPYGPLHLPAGAMGKWTSDTEFALDLNFIANINHYTMKLRFVGEGIEADVNESSGLMRNGHLKSK